VQRGGRVRAAYIRRYSGRCPLIHLKDMAADEKRSFAEVGEGTMDWPAIFAASEAGGARWYIVEQDTCQRPPLESVTLSLRNLRAMGKA
jgi:sugar phosphate isomerase/epimerase